MKKVNENFLKTEQIMDSICHECGFSKDTDKPFFNKAELMLIQSYIFSLKSRLNKQLRDDEMVEKIVQRLKEEVLKDGH